MKVIVILTLLTKGVSSIVYIAAFRLHIATTTIIVIVETSLAIVTILLIIAIFSFILVIFTGNSY